MMARTSRLFTFVFLALFLFSALIPASLYAHQEEAEQDSQAVEKKAVEEVPEVIIPAPKDKKEEIGIYIFLVWVWLSVFVLIYVLRLKVKESDRIHQLKFFPDEKK